MDREKFDALARLLGTEGSRRSTLGALLGAAVLGGSFALDAEAKKKRRRRNKKRKQRRRRRARAAAAAAVPCFGNRNCAVPVPGSGGKFEDCDLSGNILCVNSEDCGGSTFRNANLAGAILDEGKYKGNSFRDANLRSASLVGADLSGASFRGACLVDADFTGAKVSGADFRDAIFCNTRDTNGNLDNHGCDKVNDCCPGCLAHGAACGPGIAGDCCGGDVCINGVCSVECVKKKKNECPEGEVCCDNHCVDLSTNPFYCGSCFNKCDDLERCCDGICSDVQNDPLNCGGCGLACFEDEVCVFGDCLETGEEQVSDRELKTNFASVDPKDMLQRVAALPISTWNYTSDDPSVRHIGPMAQDFAALFSVGRDDKHIHTLDGQGVALAAIQGLIAELDALRAENARLASRIESLEAQA